MYSFVRLKSFHRLYELSQEVASLSEEGVVTPKRIDSMVIQTGPWKLFYSTERVNEPIVDALCDLAEESFAVAKMRSMQAGEIVNALEGVECENRAALHTAMRDFFENRQESAAASDATKLAYAELEKVKDFLSEVDAQDIYTDMVQVGIGGSELGPQAIYHGLEFYRKPNRRLHFLSNIDPDEAAAVFQKVQLQKTLFVIVSKSGSTQETMVNEAFIREKLEQAGLSPRNHLIAVTGKGSKMDDPEKYLKIFYIWDYVGGRFSVTSMVGGVTLAFAVGMDRFLDFLRGANFMDKVALRSDPKENLPLFSALLAIWNRNFLSLPTAAIIPYCSALFRLPAHIQQVEMESNGKQVDKSAQTLSFDTAPIIWGETGTNGQHSFFQLLHQGTTAVPVEFIGFKESQYHTDLLYNGTTSQEKLLSNLVAQAIALAVGQKSDNPNRYFPGNRPSHILFASHLDPFNLGALLSYYEHKTAFQGFIWNINSFDQEGVQLGKNLALKMEKQFAQARDKKGSDPKEFPLGQAFLHHFSE